MKTLAALPVFFAAGSALAQPDVAAFTNRPELEDVRISPGGTYLAYTQQTGDEEVLIVVRASDLSAVSRTGFGREIDVQSFDWANDERLLISPGRSLDGQIDVKQPTGEILGIDADGGRLTYLFGFGAGTSQTGSRIAGREAVLAAGRVIDPLPDDARRVIVQSLGYGIEGERNRAWRMDVDTGRLSTLAASPIPNGLFVTDAEHEIRFVRGVNEDDVAELYGMNERGRWDLIVTDENPAEWFEPIAPYGDEGRWLVRDRDGNGRLGVSVWNPVTMERESLFHHPEVDIVDLYFDNQGRYWAVRYDDHLPEYFYPDESHPLVALHRRLRAEHGREAHVEILDETDALDRAVVLVSGPRLSGTFLLLDTETGEALLEMPRYAELPPEALSRMDPIELAARDGETIRGYLTRPAGAADGPPPMVVIPHGGPHGYYNTWGFDFESQLLASRGYAVLHLNFRGSGGRGLDFLEAGYGEWGGLMQDDVTDATRWAIAEGLAEPGRICILGASYGGYAALTGAFREPDLYRCAIGISGVYDLNLMFEAGEIADAARGLAYFKETLGDDPAVLESRSPVANAAKILAGVMLIHGQRDARAPILHAERMRDALTEAGREVAWLTETGERHGIMSDANRARVYEEILTFLEQNLRP